MKVVAVIENLDSRYGGPAISLPELLVSLQDEYSIPVSILSTCLYEKESNEVLNHKPEIWDGLSRVLGPKKINFSIDLIKKLNKHVDSESVVYINNLWNFVSYVSFRVARKKGAMVVYAPRGSLYPWSLKQRKYFKKIALWLFQLSALNKSDVIHATCDSEKQAIRSLGIKAPVSIIPHGVSENKYLPLPLDVVYNRFSLRKDKRYVLFFSRLHKKKGLDILLDIWKEIHVNFTDWELLVAGPDYGDYVSKLRRLSTESVTYLGELYGQDKADIFSVVDFSVLPSYSENFGVVIAESLMAGVPVLCSDNTPWDSLNKSAAGACVSLSDFKDSFCDFLSLDSGRLESMGQNGRALVLKEYSWSKSAKLFYEMLKEVGNA